MPTKKAMYQALANTSFGAGGGASLYTVPSTYSTQDYLPLSGGVMRGAITIANTARSLVTPSLFAVSTVSGIADSAGTDLMAYLTTTFAQIGSLYSYLPLTGGTVSGSLATANTNDATSTTSGALQSLGGVGVSKTLRAQTIVTSTTYEVNLSAYPTYTPNSISYHYAATYPLTSIGIASVTIATFNGGAGIPIGNYLIMGRCMCNLPSAGSLDTWPAANGSPLGDFFTTSAVSGNTEVTMIHPLYLATSVVISVGAFCTPTSNIVQIFYSLIRIG